MNEQKIREIVREEMLKDYRFGDPQVAPHSHTGGDGLKVTPGNIQGVNSVPANNRKYKNPLTGLVELGFAANLTGGDPTHLSQSYETPEIKTLTQIPIILGNGAGVQGAFNGGYAPNGTIMMFANGALLSTLNVRYNGQWYQFVVNSVI